MSAGGYHFALKLTRAELRLLRRALADAGPGLLEGNGYQRDQRRRALERIAGKLEALEALGAITLRAPAPPALPPTTRRRR